MAHDEVVLRSEVFTRVSSPFVGPLQVGGIVARGHVRTAQTFPRPLRGGPLQLSCGIPPFRLEEF